MMCSIAVCASDKTTQLAVKNIMGPNDKMFYLNELGSD